MALFNYGGGGGGPRGASGKAPPPCLAGGCGGGGGGGGILANHTGHARHNIALANTIYKVTPTPDDDKFLTPNSGAPPSAASPLASPASPAKDGKAEATYGTLRKEAPTLKPVPPPTLPPAANTPTHTPMLATRAKKTVTICDSADAARATSPLSPGRI